MTTNDELSKASGDPEDMRSESYASAGLYPNRSPCPVGCKFCYERSLPEFYPKLKVAKIRPKSLKQFEFYTDQLQRFQASAIPSAPVLFENGTVIYHSASDFFAQGLTLEQLDRVVSANEATGQQPYVSTMGKDFDLATATFLQDKYPNGFRVRYSILTFNDDIKKNLIPRWGSSEAMHQIVGVLRDAHVYLLHFNCEQTMADLRAVNANANRDHKPNVGIAVVHFTKLHPAIVRQYAEDGFKDFEQLIMHLMKHHTELDNLGEISFQHPAEAFTFRFRNLLRARLAPLLIGEDDVVLCSRGAYEVMDALLVRNGARLVAVRDGLGGSTSFTTTLCTDDFIREMKLLAGERPMKRVLVPAPVWWVNSGKTCLGGGSVDELRAAFPEVELVPVEIPDEVIEARLSLRECYDYYNTDLAKTAALGAHAAQIAEHLAPNERLTPQGFVRTISLAIDEDVSSRGESISPEALRELSGDAMTVVSYEELIVDRSEESFPDDPPSAKARFHITIDGARVAVRRSIVRILPLRGAAARSAFLALFVDKRAPEDAELARSIYTLLSDLESR